MTTEPRTHHFARPFVFFAIFALVVGSFGVFASRAESVADSCGYPSGTGKTATTFNESTVLRAFSLIGNNPSNAHVQLFYNDEHTMVLGLGAGLTPFTGEYNKPATTVATLEAGDYGNGAGEVLNVGDRTQKDPAGRPLYPALFVTDITTTPTSKVGDWQQLPGTITTWDINKAQVPNAVYGTWKPDNGNDTPKNNWFLGPNADPLPPGPLDKNGNPTALKDEGYGTEVRWNVSSVKDEAGNNLVGGHTYRFQFMVHDGDQNQAGGDVGEACTTFTIPAAQISTQPNLSGGTGGTGGTVKVPVGSNVTDTATLSGNAGTPTGTVDFKLWSTRTGAGTQADPYVCSNQVGSTSTKTLSGGTATSDPIGPASNLQTYFWTVHYSGNSTYGAADEPCGTETVITVDARILLTPASAINSVGNSHTLTATVQTTEDNSTFTAVNGAAVSFAVTGSATPATGNCNTTAAGTCTFVINSTVAGSNTINATATNFTQTGVSGTFTRTTDTTHGSSGAASKTYVDASIVITPATATNAVGTPHTITATVTSTDGTTPSNAPNGTVVTFSIASGSATFVGGTNTCSTTSGLCTVVITSTAAGDNTIHAVTTFTPTGSAQALTRATDGTHGSSSDAAKKYVDAAIVITPGSATNSIGTAHTITATVTSGGGTANVPDGTVVTFSIVSGSATFVGGVNTCSTTSGICTVAINSTVAGNNAIHAVTTFTPTGANGSLTRETDGNGGNSPNAAKTYIDAKIVITPATAFNVVGTNHTITATVTSTDGTTPSNAPDGTVVTFSIASGAATFVPPATNTCTTTAGKCTIVIVSAVAGDNQIHATTTFTPTGSTGALTRATDGTHGSSGDADKVYENVRILLTPHSATNPADSDHTFTTTVQTTTDGTNWNNVGSGIVVTFNLIPGVPDPLATFNAGSTCTTAGGVCTIAIHGATAGTVTIHATTSFTVAGVGGTFTASTGTGASDNDATKTFEKLPVHPQTTLFVKDRMVNLPADATGTVTYRVYTDSSCTNLATTFGAGGDITGATNTVVGGVAPDSLIIEIDPGTTVWFQAEYSGNNKYLGQKSLCNETAGVGSGTP